MVPASMSSVSGLGRRPLAERWRGHRGGVPALLWGEKQDWGDRHT